MGIFRNWKQTQAGNILEEYLKSCNLQRVYLLCDEANSIIAEISGGY